MTRKTEFESTIPVVSREDVERVVRRDFPAAPSEALAILARYERYERDRVCLAILKLAEGDLARLRDWTKLASEDRRDVLAPAEYPNQERLPIGAELSRAERESIEAADMAQYDAWLQRA